LILTRWKLYHEWFPILGEFLSFSLENWFLNKLIPSPKAGSSGITVLRPRGNPNEPVFFKTNMVVLF
jgi:hypothetical protein